MTFPRLVSIAAATVAAVQEELPREIREIACAVPVHYEAAVAASVRAEGFEADILGLFSGDPHGEETAASNPSLPQILLYINNLWDYAEKDADLFRTEVRLTYLHELGHYFGWDEEDVAARGLD